MNLKSTELHKINKVFTRRKMYSIIMAEFCKSLIKRRDIVILTSVFILSRIIFFLNGVDFDAKPILYYLQYIDPVHLKERLLQSLFYLHSQPPLFNLFLGVILKIFPTHYSIIFQWFYLMCGLTLMYTLYALMIRLNTNNIIALVLTSLFIIHPSTIIFENFLLYSYPVTVLLLLATLSLNIYLESDHKTFTFLFFILLMALALTRSTFHLVWYIIWTIILVKLKSAHRKKILLAACIPFLILLSVYVKNYCLFKKFTTSSTWLGFQFGKSTLGVLAEDDLEKLVELVKEGKISKVSASEIYGGYKLVGKTVDRIEEIPVSGIPILDERMKPSKDENPNFNSLRALKSSEYYIKDGLYVLKNFPHTYLTSLKRSFLVYFFPGPTDMIFQNRLQIKEYENYYNFMFIHLNRINNSTLYLYHLFELPYLNKIKWDAVSILCYILVVGYYLTLTIYGLTYILKRKKSNYAKTPSLITLIFIWGNIIYITVISNAFGFFGNNRYRFTIDPFFWILLGLFLTELANKLRKTVGKGYGSQ